MNGSEREGEWNIGKRVRWLNDKGGNNDASDGVDD
mgnify:CR=1 FL=1